MDRRERKDCSASKVWNWLPRAAANYPELLHAFDAGRGLDYGTMWGNLGHYFRELGTTTLSSMIGGISKMA